MTLGKSLSYYYYTDEDITFMSYLAGRLDTENRWEFVKVEGIVNLGDNDVDTIEDALSNNLKTFLVDQAVPFWTDPDVPANENTFGHPV